MLNRECGARQNEFNQIFTGDGEINMDIDVNMANSMSGMGMNMNMNQGPTMQGMTSQPIIEPMQERVVNRTIMHEVPQV